jgi:L-methionine (R)-S-oxide reductase
MPADPFHAPAPTLPKSEVYADLASQLKGLMAGESDLIANTANMAAVIYHGLPDLNWAGFYLMKDGELVLGPFQGKPACIRIPIGKGVCGTAAETRASQVVADVHDFPGHIACDAASRSELVVPLLTGDRALGVLDLDSPLPGRFDQQDREGCEMLVGILLDHIKADHIKAD